ncbi:MAG: hypothetical protein ACKO0W_05540 [Planctomycetota bacterium]
MTAVLAALAASAAAADRRELPAEVASDLQRADGTRIPCAIRAWDEDGLEGSCGKILWIELKPASAFATLKALVPAKDAAAAADAVEALCAVGLEARFESSVAEWAKREGVDATALAAAKAEGARRRTAREDAAKEALAKECARIDPEAGVAGGTLWTALQPEAFETASAESLEAARALFARAGGSATVHQASRVMVLAESGDAVHRDDAAFLDRLADGWSADFDAAGCAVALQGRAPVVLVADRDRWRLLVASAFGGDPAQHPDAVTIYPDGRPIALVAPHADRSRLRAAAATALARALLFSAARSDRGPAWVNEGLPRVLADIAVPAAGIDASLRGAALPAIRAGALPTVLASDYCGGAWKSDRSRAIAVSYVFTRWLHERSGLRLVTFAKDRQGGEDDAARFKRAFRATPAQATAAAAKWFQTND